MGRIDLKDVRKSFGAVEIIKGVDLSVEEGEFVIFVGPSGCGKSTLLRLISGLEEATDGHILIDGDDVTGKPPAERGLSMVFQSYALYPHKTVRENMGFGLQVARTPKTEIAERVQSAAAVLKLEELLDRRPKELSGGQRQRVAIGRSIVREPRAFLFDEPLSNLDAALRVEMRLEIAKLHQRLKATMIYVTHDQVEAMTLADRIVVLQKGRIEQVGSPIELYQKPANLFVAQFIGSPKMNVVPCRGTAGAVSFSGGGSFPLARATPEAIHFGVRPEHIRLVEAGAGSIDGVIDVIERLGSDTYAYVQAGDLGLITVRIVGHAALRPEERVGLAFDPEAVHIFSADGQAIAG
ncbi:ABC transporter ATP-binding protein [Consotaella aegiceratis]|uniref:ABC transporter ATP-binding protein n=1 Tax=Consotaella aegiceratis TaxID=3097961 RepID=UPI002F42E87D